MDYFYDGQIRRYVTQFMRIFIGFKYKTGGDTPEERNVPVLYGDMTRQVASIIKDNSENKMSTVPRVACYISGLELDTTRLSDATFVSKVNIRERRYEDVAGNIEYQNAPGGSYTVERLMPTPFKLSMKAELWTSNTDQKLQLLEQILVLFNPSLEIQTTDNYIDWTSLSVIDLTSTNFSSRSIPQGAESEIDICSMEFSMPIFISPPSKVKRLGVVQSVINNVFTEQGDIVDLEDLVYNRRTGTFATTTNRYRVLLFKANNGQDYDYELTLVNPDAAVLALGLDQKSIKTGAPVDWNSILEVQGGIKPNSQAYFKQASGYDMVGNIAVNPIDTTIMIVTFDRDTIPQNTLINSSVTGIAARGTVDAIIDPYKYNPVEVYGSQAAIPLGLRFLMLDDVNNSVNTGGLMSRGQDPADGSSRDGYDGPDGWKNKTGGDPVIVANSIIEWNGTTWIKIWNPVGADVPTYIQNLRTGIKYRWDGEQWLKAFEGEYAPNFWGFKLDPL